MEDFLNNLEKKLRDDIPVCMSSAIDNAMPIWKLLNMTEEEYNKEYHKLVIEEKVEVAISETGIEETIKEIKLQ